MGDLSGMQGSSGTHEGSTRARFLGKRDRDPESGGGTGVDCEGGSSTEMMMVDRRQSKQEN